jgi:hypothetical protein
MRPADIQNPICKSGYAFVHYSTEIGHTRPKPFQAKINGGKVWYGPRRATAIEAAQDYCDWINGSTIVIPSPRLKSAGHFTIKEDKGEVSAKKVEAYQLLAEATADEGNDPSGYVYVITDGTAVKIGKSAGHPQNRLKGLQTGNPRLLRLIAWAYVPDRKAAEVEMHVKFQSKNVLGEWFEYDEAILKAVSKLG